jgi:hypothetical protein
MTIDSTIANAPVRDWPCAWWMRENEVWYRQASGSLVYYRNNRPIAQVLREGAHWVPVVANVRSGRFTTRRTAVEVVAKRVAYGATVNR